MYHIPYRAINIFHHTVPSYHTTDTNIYRTNVPYHIPCHILFPPHRAIIPYHPHTVSHTVPQHTQCHAVPCHIPYQTISYYPYHTQPKIPTLTGRQKTHTNSKIKNIDKKCKKNVQKSVLKKIRNSIQI